MNTKKNSYPIRLLNSEIDRKSENHDGNSTEKAGLNDVNKVKTVDSQTAKRKCLVPGVDASYLVVNVSSEDAKNWFPRKEQKEQVDVTDLGDPGPKGFAGIWKSPILLSLSVLIISTFMLFLINQVLAFVQAVETAPLALRVTCRIALALLCLALLFSIIRLWWSLWSLSVNPKIYLPHGNDRSASRKAWSFSGPDKLKVEALLGIIRNYPRDQVQEKLLKRGKIDVTEFQGNLDYLLKPHVDHDIDWLKNCQEYYVKPLKDCANQLLYDYTKKVALKTALVRNGIMDSLIIGVNTVLLYEELCRVFNVRTTRLDSLLMVARLAYITMISAKTADYFEDGLEQVTEEGSATIFEYVTTEFVKYGLKGAGESAANYFLFQRLGKAAISDLLPVKTK